MYLMVVKTKDLKMVNVQVQFFQQFQFAQFSKPGVSLPKEMIIT